MGKWGGRFSRMGRSVSWVGRCFGRLGGWVDLVVGSIGCVGWWVGQLGERISHFRHVVMLYFVLYLLALSFLLHKTFV